MAGKGSKQRPTNHKSFSDGFDRIFGKADSRPSKGGWITGGYCCECVHCGEKYQGYKRSFSCADCAYKD